MLQTLAQSLAAAEAGGYAVGAFNVSDLNQAYAVLTAARRTGSPVIVQAIAGMAAYEDEAWWWARLREVVVSFDDVPAVLHLDHGRSYDDCARAIDAGFSSVMIDASRDEVTDEPSDFDSNVALSLRVVEIAHPAGVSVEGELGTIGGAEAGVRGEVDEIVFADPEQAEEFVRRTGVDALAVAVGTSHGSVKLGSQRLRIPLIAEIKERLPNTYLVLHGSSSIPGEAVATINAHGGELPESHGIDTEQKQQAIESGIRKINQGTDSHLAWTAALREFSDRERSVVEPSIATAVAMGAMERIVEQRMHEFGSVGRAAALTPAGR
ncbi:ketose-bisphosphate aldolase [Herbiconiux sp. L3-i23]|uniref:ketose-bisphosphate aldolase n=1 Tax=Herbiconiux sp. L3-i23 TaxID=2905871 RepID=UPI00205D6643|nr:ketose-bisphosphate aldolase [Herbiconiux sp. L3-i23]BDI22110.1 fructose-1,6-bisphosphate aldolase [Herbiconiux sp. L3-i23]